MQLPDPLPLRARLCRTRARINCTCASWASAARLNPLVTAPPRSTGIRFGRRVCSAHAASWGDDSNHTGTDQNSPTPSSARLFSQIIDRPENRRYGLYHLKDSQTIVLKSTTLAEAMRRHLFAPGDPYLELVHAITLLGPEAVEVEISEQ